jgi:iron only hydrogenase large subunit-like protein
MELLANKEYKDVYCLLIGPCFDKKLEASREEMKENKTPINVVLSTEEIHTFLREQNLLNAAIESLLTIKEYGLLTSETFIKAAVGHNDNDSNGKSESTTRILTPSKISLEQFRLTRSHYENGTSNGYLDYILRRELQRLSAVGVKKTQRKNKNHMEFDLELPDGTIRKFAFVYGFKNIQNVIMQVKTKKCKYLYCEVMACPSGCLNGGGQIRYEGEQQRTENLESLYNRMDSKEFVEHQSVVQAFLARLDDGSMDGLITKSYFNYKIEEIKQTDALKLNW